MNPVMLLVRSTQKARSICDSSSILPPFIISDTNPKRKRGSYVVLAYASGWCGWSRAAPPWQWVLHDLDQEFQHRRLRQQRDQVRQGVVVAAEREHARRHAQLGTRLLQSIARLADLDQDHIRLRERAAVGRVGILEARRLVLVLVSDHDDLLDALAQP